MLGREALELPDGYGLVDLAAPTLALAGMVADVAQDPGEGDLLSHHRDGGRVVAFPDEADIPGYVYLRRAERSCRGREPPCGSCLRSNSSLSWMAPVGQTSAQAPQNRQPDSASGRSSRV